MRKERLFIITDELPPKLGGVGNVMYALCTELNEKYELVLISFSKFEKTAKKISEKQVFFSDHFWASLRDLKLLFLYIKLFLIYGKSLKIITSSWKLTLPAALFNHFFNNTFYSYAQGTDISKAIERGHSERLKKRDRQIKYWIAVSQYMIDSLVDLSISRNKIKLIQNGVDLNRFHNIDKNEAKKLLKIDGDLVFLSASRLDPIKGVDIAIGLVYELVKIGFKNIHYYILGSGESKYEEKLRELVEKLGLAENVHFVGFINPYTDNIKGHNMLNLYYNACDLFLSLNKTMPSGEADASPMNIREAMSTGAIPVAGTSGGAKEIIENRKSGFLFDTDNLDLIEISKQIVEIIKDEKKLEQMSIVSSEFVKRELSWKKQINKLVELVTEEAK